MDKKNGFSLVEIMVSTVVFSLVVLGLISVFVSASKQITHIRERMTSVQLGKFFLDPLQADVRYDTWSDLANQLYLTSGWEAGVAQTINNRNFAEEHRIEEISGTDLRRVVSKISWTE